MGKANYKVDTLIGIVEEKLPMEHKAGKRLQ
jgi:hypothetical protein